MRSWALLLALTMCACTDDHPGPEAPDPQPSIPEVGEIPEVESEPASTEPAPAEPETTTESVSEPVPDGPEMFTGAEVEPASTEMTIVEVEVAVVEGDPPAEVVEPEPEPEAWTDGPDYHSLRGSALSEGEADGWVVRGSAGYGGDDYAAMDDAGYALVEEAESVAMSTRSSRGPSLRGLTRGRRASAGKKESRRPDAMTDIPYAAQAATPLRAGTTDDNVAYGDYLEFLGTWTDRAGMSGSYQRLDVRDRSYVRVVDRTGSPLPGARVRIQATGEDVQLGTTYGDGTLPFYPHLSVDGSSRPWSTDGYAVDVSYGDERTVVPWDGRQMLTVQLQDDVPMEAVIPLDVVFLIDTTGSMADEIDRIKSTLLSVTEDIRGLQRPVELRYGAVLYRDIGDEYVTKRHPFTNDIQSFDQALRGIYAGGGGDGPESLNQGLAESVYGMEWRNQSAKLVFLVADAPPHMDYQGDLYYGSSAVGAVQKGIRVHTVAASGLDSYGGVGSLVYRQTAQLTQGKFIFIEYGSTAASAASHGVTGPVQSNNLDAILFSQIKAEVEGWRSPQPLVAAR